MRRLIFLLFVLFPTIANAAQIKFLPKQLDGLETIFLTGELKAGDAVLFYAMIEKAKMEGVPVRRLVVNSPGGMLPIGMAIAEIVHREGIEVLVLQRNHCSSACFLIFSAAPKRDIFESSVIGVHRAAFQIKRRIIDAPEATRDMIAQLYAYGVPWNILRVLQATPQPRVRDLTISELRGMGAVVEPESFFVVGL